VKKTAKPAKKAAKKAARTAKPGRKTANPAKPAKKVTAPKVPKQLTPKQQQFVAVYLANGFNGTRAAIAAGYARGNADTQASRLLAQPLIAAAVVAGKQKLLEKQEITAEWVLNGIRSVAAFDVRKLFRADGSLVPITELDAETAAGLAGFEARESHADGFHVANIKKVKHADRLRALELLGRYLKLFTDKVEHSGVLGVQLITSVPRPKREAIKE